MDKGKTYLSNGADTYLLYIRSTFKVVDGDLLMQEKNFPNQRPTPLIWLLRSKDCSGHDSIALLIALEDTEYTAVQPLVRPVRYFNPTIFPDHNTTK